MKQEYPVAQIDELPEGKHIIVQVRGREIGLFNVKGQFYALPNVCFHQNGPLCRGAVSGTIECSAESNWQRSWTHEGEIVVCPWHSLEFNVTNGQCLAYPGRKLPTYEVRVNAGQISVVL